MKKETAKKAGFGVTLLTSLEKGNMKHTFEATGYGTVKIFDRVARTYRLFTRYGIGGSFRYVNRYTFGSKLKSKQRTNRITDRNRPFLPGRPHS